jgi:hypothetical protein
MTRTHKASGWQRVALGHGDWRIVPTDDTGDRVVAFMSAGSWANLPTDDRARVNQDRIVLKSGAPLPAWAIAWLDTANRRSCQSGRDALRAALDDADNNDPAWRDW